jgi:hypothetical protein
MPVNGGGRCRSPSVVRPRHPDMTAVPALPLVFAAVPRDVPVDLRHFCRHRRAEARRTASGRSRAGRSGRPLTSHPDQHPDDLWGSGYWENAIAPGDPCEACDRRASIHVYGGPDTDLGAVHDYMENYPVHVCGWCHLGGPMLSEADVERELGLARADSVAWRWRSSALRT